MYNNEEDKKDIPVGNQENNNINNDFTEEFDNSTSHNDETQNYSEGNTYPNNYQQDDQYYNNSNNVNNNNFDNGQYNNNYDNSQYNNGQYNNNSGNDNGQYMNNNNNNYNYTQNEEKKKPKKAKKNRTPGRGKRFAKTLSLVAGTIIIAFAGGMVGGYLAKDKNTSNTTTTQVDPSKVAASEFLSNKEDGTLTVAQAIEKVKPAVVTISTTTIVNNSSSDFSSIFGGNSGQQVEEGIGSGFIISDDGYIITNYHVVEGSTNVKVLLSTGDEVGGKVVNYDEEKDIAMVKLDDASKIPGVATLGDSDALYAGEEVIAIGTPLSTDYSATCTKGIISAVNRNVQTSTGITMNLIQTDAAINPGNSGGPLINTKGEVIGINNMKIVDSEVEGIGFSIPINEAADRIETLSKPIITLGISVIEITDDLAKQNDLPKGLYVQDVTDFSSAQKAGMKIGDVIVKFDGKSIETRSDLTEAKSKKNVGDKVEVVVSRNGKEVKLNMTLESGSTSSSSSSNSNK